jgi:GNAT superfamily N-acetyltransferase
MRSFLDFLRESHSSGKLAFRTRKERTDFGHAIHFDAKQGRFALYWYDDDLSKIYLSNVDIWKDYRGIGLGTILLSRALEEAKKLSQQHGFKSILLNCRKDSFVHSWYQRNGFEDYKPKDRQHVWIERKIR